LVSVPLTKKEQEELERLTMYLGLRNQSEAVRFAIRACIRKERYKRGLEISRL